MADRDPRVDPRPGDVVERDGYVYLVATSGPDYWCHVVTREGKSDRWYYPLDQWRETFATANVLRVAP